ncbi:zinc finger BED domain-containing protein RICESLEEPER 2-like protein [Tanacetum coccineum]
MERGPGIINVETSNSEEGIAAQQENVASTEEHTSFKKRKRKKTAGVWAHFDEIKLSNETEMDECKHCSSSVVQNWKFDNARMRELVSHMIMVHELPFTFVEYDLFNLLIKEANLAFNKISRASTRQDCISSYEIGRKKIQKLLNSVNRVSITIDMWTSNQNIHYMVVTCHFVDSDFKLNKCILSFVDVPPPYSGIGIYDCLFKCLKELNQRYCLARSKYILY